MDWASFPATFPGLFEKIIGCAVDVEEAERALEDKLAGDCIFTRMNFTESRIGHYGRVCRNWKAAMFTAGRRFKMKYMPDICLGTYEDNADYNDPRKLIREGYLAMAKRFSFGTEETFPQFIFDHAEHNSIEDYDISLSVEDTKDKVGSRKNEYCTLTADNVHDITRLILMSKMANKFTISTVVDSQCEAELLWKLLGEVVVCNKRPKQITCDVLFRFKPDWSFTEDTGTMKGVIECLDITNWKYAFWDGVRRNYTEEYHPKYTNLNTPNWSALAHFIEHVTIEPMSLDCILGIKADCLWINESDFYFCSK